MGCACKGLKVAVFGALIVANHYGLGFKIDQWLLVGILLIVAGAMKAVWPCGCPVHGNCCSDKGMAKAKKGK